MSIPLNAPHINKALIRELFATMSFSPGSVSDNIAMEWLEKHNNFFSSFIDGSWISEGKHKGTTSTDSGIETVADLYKVCDPFSGKVLAEVLLPSEEIVNAASKSSYDGFDKWSSLNPEKRTKYLFSVAQNIEKHQQLFALVESLSTGKHFYKTKTKDVPNLIQSFYHYAGWAFNENFKDWKPTGVICIVSEEYNNPLLSISWRISSVLAAGNSALILVDVKSCLSAFLLAEIFNLSGIPPGVLNVLPIAEGSFPFLPKASKFIFTGSTKRSKMFIQKTSKSCIPCEVLISSRPTVIVYEDADLDSAANSVLETLFFNDTRTESGGCKVFVQESVHAGFLKTLQRNFSNKILVGRNLSKTDISCIVTEEQLNELIMCIDEAKDQGAEITLGPDVQNVKYPYYRPVLLKNVQTSSKIVHEELGGPVVVTIPFRTVKESIAMFNCKKKGSCISVWTERVALALETAQKLKTGTIWLNSQNLIDASAAFGGIYLNGSSVEGGKRAFLSHLTILKPGTKYLQNQNDSIESYGLKSSCATYLKENQGSNIVEYGHYIGGMRKESSNCGSFLMTDKANKPHAYVAAGSSSDINSAVSNALVAQPKWETLTKYKRSQILLQVVKNINKRKEEFISTFDALLGYTAERSADEVEKSLNILTYWAFQINNICGSSEDTPCGKILQDHFPVGVIGIQCPDEQPLLSFLSLVVPAIVFGNAVVVIPSEKYPVLTLKVCEIFTISNLPGGVINVVTGCRDHLTRHLCLHLDVDAFWFSCAGGAFIFNSCCVKQKKIFFCADVWNGLSNAISEKLFIESTFPKTIYMLAGDIYAN